MPIRTISLEGSSHFAMFQQVSDLTQCGLMAIVVLPHLKLATIFLVVGAVESSYSYEHPATTMGASADSGG